MYILHLDYHLDRISPNTQTWLKTKECRVTGADFCKYFKRFD